MRVDPPPAIQTHPVLQLFPTAQGPLPLEGLYLSHALHRRATVQAPVVYTNFITSLDGRIALRDAATGAHRVPGAIANARDWRLYQELGAQAHVLLTSGRYLRALERGSAQSTLSIGDSVEYQDLRKWRLANGLSPQPAVAVVSSGLDIPVPASVLRADHPLYVITGQRAAADKARRLERRGARVIRADAEHTVDGNRLVEALVDLGFASVYSTAGPQVLHTLLQANRLDRLYLTLAHRILGGKEFDTLLNGELLRPPAQLRLAALYYDPVAPEGAGQCFALFQRHAGADPGQGGWRRSGGSS